MPILIIDCNYICHKAKNTTGPLRYKDKPTGVIYGFLQQLMTLAWTIRPSKTVFVWDSKHSIRKNHYPFYKEKRREKSDDPDEIDHAREAYRQFRELRVKILPEIGMVNNFIQSGYEGDDLMTRICEDQDNEIILATADDDLLQTLDINVQIYNPAKKDHYYTHARFVQDYKGLRPTDYTEILKIAGCNTDCVPGISGIGKATAAKFLRGELNPISKKYTDIVSKEGRRIRQRNDFLVRLPLPDTRPIELQENELDVDRLRLLCKELGFRQWLQRGVVLDDLKIVLK